MTKLRWRRRLRRSQNSVENLGTTVEDNLEKNLFKRLSRLSQVRKFIAAWVMLFILLVAGTLWETRFLGRYYLSPQPAPGGIYTEGILGSFTNANPIYSASSVDNSVERLVFSGLFRFNDKNQLVGDLADSYKIDERGTTYTVQLKNNLTWQDGSPLTAADVVYTYNMIQNPDAKSPLLTSWQGIKVTAPSDHVIKFTLPSILSSFPYSMVNGILPKHLLDGIPAAQLRSISFNTNRPIGSGPFKWEAVEVVGNNPEEREQRIALVPFKDHVGGAPKLEKFIIRTYNDDKKLGDALKKQEINAAVGLSNISDSLKKDTAIHDFDVPLTSQVMVFFKNTSAPFTDIKIRQALSYSINNKSILSEIDRPLLPSTGPLLKGQVGFDEKDIQKSNNKDQAKKLLDEAGWKASDTGLRYKDGKPLSFALTTQENSVYKSVADNLKKQWGEVGVNVEIITLKDVDLQSSLGVHNYDALLYGIELGPDPDVFAYWHSSQADLRSPNHFNFSEYNSGVADKALEAGRTRSEPGIRAVKYKPFLDSWVNDAPAISLYQPTFLYVTKGPLFGFQPTSMNNGADRFNNILNWQIREKQQPVR